jgi:hypothetical protein
MSLNDYSAIAILTAPYYQKNSTHQQPHIFSTHIDSTKAVSLLPLQYLYLKLSINALKSFEV